MAEHELWSFSRVLASDAAWGDLTAGSAGAIPAAVAIGSWSAILLGLRMPDRTERWIMGLSFACVPLIVLLPLSSGVVADVVLSAKDYQPCRVEPGRRFLGVRYDRAAPDLCP